MGRRGALKQKVHGAREGAGRPGHRGHRPRPANNFAFNYTYSVGNPNALQADGTPVGAQWETLTVCAPAGIEANQVFVYAINAPAVFYVDQALVWPDSNCP